MLTPSSTEPLSLPDSDTKTLVKSSSSYSSSFISVTAATLFSDDSSYLSDDESAVLFCVVLLFSLSICLLPDEHPKIDCMVNKTVRDIAAIFLLIIIALPFCVYFTLYTVK